MADDAKESGAEDAPEAAKPSLIKKLLLPVMGLVTLGAVAFAGLLFGGVISLGGGGEGDPAEAATAQTAAPSGSQPGAPAYYFTLYPDMLVNFTVGSRSRFIKLTIDVMSRDEAVVKGVEEHQAIVRNNLLSSFQDMDFAVISSAGGMQAMRERAEQEIENVLASYHGPNEVEGVYFTSFVIQ